MNGSRLQEHRKRRVPATNWMILVAVIAAILALSPMLSKGAEPLTQTFNADTGLIVYGGKICAAETIDVSAVKLLDEWVSLVNKVETWQLDGRVRLTQEEGERGKFLSSNKICAVVADYYMITILEEVNDYLLFKFDSQYGFTDTSLILKRSQYRSDRGR